MIYNAIDKQQNSIPSKRASLYANPGFWGCWTGVCIDLFDFQDFPYGAGPLRGKPYQRHIFYLYRTGRLETFSDHKLL